MSPLLATVDAVVFDLDGTLVETNIDFPLMKREMIALAVSVGMDPDPLVSRDILAIVDLAVEHLRFQGMPDLAAHTRARAMAILQEIELRHADRAEEIPFARELVGILKERGIRIGIATRNCRAASEISLAFAGIVPDAMVCREDTSRHKPYPDQLQLVLEALAARPERSIMVGDHLMDITSGKAAGMSTIGFLREHRDECFFDGVAPDLVVRSLREVLDAIIDRNR